ncbi:hypothetical protein MRX96_015205 [Rhipicephalus microplus]
MCAVGISSAHSNSSKLGPVESSCFSPTPLPNSTGSPASSSTPSSAAVDRPFANRALALTALGLLKRRRRPRSAADHACRLWWAAPAHAWSSSALRFKKLCWQLVH